MKMSISAQRILGTMALITSFLFIASCGSAPQPTPAPVSKGSAPTEAKPAATAAAKLATADAAKPAASDSAKPAASSNWQAEWDKVLAAAKKEGKVVVSGFTGEEPRQAAMEFQKSYPDITVEFTGLSEAIRARVLAERQAGQYLWDVQISGPPTMHDAFIPGKAVDPLRPALILPEVLDDSNWFQGFDDGWSDRERKYSYEFLGYVSRIVLVNRDIVPESELKSLDNLVDPKWAGKIVFYNPAVSGPGTSHAAHLLEMKGEEWYRKLLANVEFTQDRRGMLEALHRGRYAMAIGVSSTTLEELQGSGLLPHVYYVESNTKDGQMYTSGTGAVALFNNAPHPNAAKVFINWLLSKKGQEAYVQRLKLYSRRLDVVGPPDQAPQPGMKYMSSHKEWRRDIQDKAVAIAKEFIK